MGEVLSHKGEGEDEALMNGHLQHVFLGQEGL